MSRKEELLKLVSLLHSQAKAMNSRTAKQAFRKIADYYQHEADLAKQPKGPAPELFIERGKRCAPLNRLHKYWGLSLKAL
jgi:hypothetical protein